MRDWVWRLPAWQRLCLVMPLVVVDLLVTLFAAFGLIVLVLHFWLGLI